MQGITFYIIFLFFLLVFADVNFNDEKKMTPLSVFYYKQNSWRIRIMNVEFECHGEIV